MLVRVLCIDCNTSGRMDVDVAKAYLRRNGTYGFGDHVRDDRAFVMRYMRTAGWWTTTIPLGKSTITMRCPAHDEVEVSE